MRRQRFYFDASTSTLLFRCINIRFEEASFIADVLSRALLAEASSCTALLEFLAAHLAACRISWSKKKCH
jgi:hypothetical protein